MARKTVDPDKDRDASRRMHQTTLRFGPDLWDALSEEARAAGVSVAQFVREAALARLAYTAGRRGDLTFEAALRGVGGVLPSDAEPAPLAFRAQSS